MTRLIVLASLSTLWITSCDALAGGLAGDVETILAEEGLTGVVWSLLGDDGDVSLGAVGLQDAQAGSGITIDTRVHVGSLTKAVLATGVLRMASQGLIWLDEPVSNYLPGFHVDNPWAESSPVTVRHLLDHTSGLNDAYMWQMFSERATPDSPLGDAFPGSETQLLIRSRPGSRFSYSNMGYALLGMLIESVTGARYESYLDENLLAPLEMHDSTFEFTTQEGESADPMLAWGHVDDGSRYAASPIFLRPAGQFTTTVGDLARFAKFLLGDGTVGSRQFIDGTLMRLRGRPTGTLAAEGGLAAGYALGLGRRDRHGVVGYCHGGNIVGFFAMLCIFPDERRAFAYSVNTDSETADYGRLESRFIDEIGIATASTAPTAQPDSDISSWPGWYSLSPNRFQTFEYLDRLFAAVKVSARQGGLTLTPVQGVTRELRPLGGYAYSANDRATASHVLLKDATGQPLISDGFKTYEKVSLPYLATHWASLILGVGGLAWLLLSGVVALLRYRTRILRRPDAPVLASLALLCLPIPFFMNQSFMALGDFTTASAMLAIVTLILPLGLLYSLYQTCKNWRSSCLNFLHGLAVVCVLQWCVVLATAGLLPLRLWAV